jgi:CDP-paratose synthetase
LNKKIIITGVNGFLGSKIAINQILSGNTVIGLIRKSSDLSRLDHIRNHLSLVEIDYKTFDKCFFENVDAVIHTATCYGRYNESFSDILAANVTFPLKLLEESIAADVPVFLNTDSFL